MDKPNRLGFEEIRRLIPQAYPFLMVDRVNDLVPNERITAIKNVTGNEGFFQGHFPDLAVMPAALILEGLAQATIVLARKSAPPEAGASEDIYLFGAVHARMHRPVFPGDVLQYEIKLLKLFGEGGAADGRATVDGTLCAQAEMYFSKVDAAALRRQQE